MKKLISFSLLLFTLSLSTIFFTGSLETENKSPKVLIPTSGGGDNFIIGAFSTGWDINFAYVSNTLGFNLWHIYDGNEFDSVTGRNYPTGWIYNQNLAPGDTLFADSSAYFTDVKDVLTRVTNNNMQALMMRPKIEWLVNGQRSDYQCEEISSSNDLWFYSFNDHPTGEDITDNSQFGIGEKVRYCEAGTHSANIVVKRLMANAEQSNSGGDFHGDSQCTWFVKPRIRIDSTFAHNSGDTLVCKIIVIGSSGIDTLKNVDIKASNFINPTTGNYGGQYIDQFYFSPGTDLNIQGEWGDGWQYSARGDNPTDGWNKADIQVKWYGKCDMWIDYIRVDNDVAHKLLGTTPDPDFEKWIQ